MKRDHDAEWARWTSWIEHVGPARVGASPASPPPSSSRAGLSNRMPSLRVFWDRKKLGTGRRDQVARTLFESDPARRASFPARHETRSRPDRRRRVNPYMMAPGDEKVVADRLHALLTEPRRARTRSRPAAAPPPTSAGRGTCGSNTRPAPPRHGLTLRQQGNDVDGAHRGDFMTRDLTRHDRRRRHPPAQRLGRADGDALNYTFNGKVTGDEMGGTLDMGEYLGGRWSARRRRPREGGERNDSCEPVRRPRVVARRGLAAGAHGSGRRPEVRRRCCAAGTSSIRRTASTRCATSPSRAARSRRWPPRIDPAEAFKTIDVSGLYVTPGLIDIHAHVYTGTGEKGSYAGDNSVYPDGFTFRVGVTTVVGRGRRGLAQLRGLQGPRHRPLEDARARLPQHRRQRHARRRTTSRTSPTWRRSRRRRWRRSTPGSSSASRPRTTAARSGRRSRTRWRRARRANIPVMVDFGANKPERPLAELVTKKLRPGDIYTHVYSGLRNELDPATGKVNPGLFEGRKRGVDLRRGPRRRQLRLARGRARDQGGLPARLDLDRPAHRQHERGHEGHAQRDEQVPGPGTAARRRRPAVDLESGAGDQAGAARAPVRRRARRRGRAAAGEGQLRVRGLVRRAAARRSSAWRAR